MFCYGKQKSCLVLPEVSFKQKQIFREGEAVHMSHVSEQPSHHKCETDVLGLNLELLRCS